VLVRQTVVGPQAAGVAREQPVSVKISTRDVHNITIVDVSGRIVLGDETASLRDVVRDLLAKDKKKIILNLADVTYIDSWAVGQLVSSWTTTRNAGGELKLLNLTQKVIDVLHVTRLYSVFDIKDDEFSAIKSFDYFFAR
jgi:anti-sigma B factor antagonist